ncbi:MAG: Fe-S-binding domain-containing protein, partial [bacterium]|nr:Fe-S-binding domain-containing protein [bacterium]
MDPSLLLIIAIFLPVAGACVLSLLAPLGNTAVRWAALATTLATLVVAGILMVQYPAEGSTEAQFVTDAVWLQMDPVEIHFNIGIDGLTVWLFGLSALLMVTAVLVSWNAIKENAPLFFGMLLLLETGCLGVFAARDI